MVDDAAHSRAGTLPSITAGSLDEQTRRELDTALRAMYNHFEKENLHKQLQQLVDRLGEKRGDL